MKPKYKVINSYPNSPFKIGDILKLVKNGSIVFFGKLGWDCKEYLAYWNTTNQYGQWDIDYILQSELDKYPHLFKKIK